MVTKCVRLIAVIMLVFAGAAQLMAQNRTFYFTAIPSEDEKELVARYGKFAAYLEQKLGMQVVYVPMPTYDAAIKAFMDNKVQLAWFGGYTGLKARQAVPGSEAIAHGYEDASFKTYFIAHSSSGLKASTNFPREIAGKTFIFGSQRSTSGRVVPEYWIRKKLGKGPGDVFSRVSFSGDHASTLDLVQAGVSQVGVLSYLVFDAAKAAGKVDGSKVSVIWETPPYPDDAFVLRGDAGQTFGEGFGNKLTQIILAIDDKEMLKAFGRSKFIPVTNEEYLLLEEMVAVVEDAERTAGDMKR